MNLYLNKDDEQWFRNHYPHISNATIAIYLGVHIRTVARIARRLGVEKTPEYLRSCHNKPIKQTKAY